VDWYILADDGAQWQDTVNTAMNLRCHKRHDICWLVGLFLVTI
jgi:hypothetical protein